MEGVWKNIIPGEGNDEIETETRSWEMKDGEKEICTEMRK